MDRRSRLRGRGSRRRRLLIIIMGGLLAALFLWLGQDRLSLFFQRAVTGLGLSDEDGSSAARVHRGIIYDRNFRELALTYERVSVYANIREINDLADTVTRMAAILKRPSDEISARLSGNAPRVWLARDISQEQEELIGVEGFRGIYLHREYVRTYPQHTSAAHLIGYAENNSGLAGIEHYLNEIDSRYRHTDVERGGYPLISEGRPGVNGNHLILTLDLKIQNIAERFLATMERGSSTSRIGVMVIEPQSGAIVGYAQNPSFDPNEFHRYGQWVFNDIFLSPLSIPRPLYDFIHDVFALSAADEQGALPPWSIAAGGGEQSLPATWWDRLGGARPLIPDFGVMVPAAGTPAPARHNGTGIPEDEKTVPALSPVQLVTALTRVLNGGDAIEVHAADRFVARINQREYLLAELSPGSEGAAVSAAVSEEAQHLFTALGTPGPLQAVNLSTTSYSSGWEKGYQAVWRHRVIFSVLPGAHPELIFMVVISEPGFSVTAISDPVAQLQTILAPIIGLQRVMKNVADVVAPRQLEEVNLAGSRADRLTDTIAPPESPSGQVFSMPLLMDMSLRKSLRSLRGMDVQLMIYGTGRVVRQEPAPGTRLEAGATIELYLERDQVERVLRTEQ
jgi:cell division protein FtsI (penicillin-binding protein 3)